MQGGLRASWGSYLRELRAGRGWTLERLEELTLGAGHRIPRSRLSELERGAAPTQAEDLQALAKVFGFSYARMLQEAMVRCPAGKYTSTETSESLLEQGKALFGRGEALESGWAFDRAAERAGEDAELFAEARVRAAHAFNHAGAEAAALARVEEALDRLTPESKNWLQALGYAAILLAASGARGRALLVLKVIESDLPPDDGTFMSAYLVGVVGWSWFQLGDFRKAVEFSLEAARRYKLQGEFHQACRKMAVAALSQFRLGDRSSALRLAREAVTTAVTLPNLPVRCFAHLVLGEILAADDPRAAVKPLEEAVDLARRHSLHEEAARSLDLLETVAAKLGRSADVSRCRRLRRGLPVIRKGLTPRQDYGLPADFGRES